MNDIIDEIKMTEMSEAINWSQMIDIRFGSKIEISEILEVPAVVDILEIIEKFEIFEIFEMIETYQVLKIFEIIDMSKMSEMSEIFEKFEMSEIFEMSHKSVRLSAGMPLDHVGRRSGPARGDIADQLIWSARMSLIWIADFIRVWARYKSEGWLAAWNARQIVGFPMVCHSTMATDDNDIIDSKLIDLPAPQPFAPKVLLFVDDPHEAVDIQLYPQRNVLTSRSSMFENIFQ